MQLTNLRVWAAGEVNGCFREDVLVPVYAHTACKWLSTRTAEADRKRGGRRVLFWRSAESEYATSAEKRRACLCSSLRSSRECAECLFESVDLKELPDDGRPTRFLFWNSIVLLFLLVSLYWAVFEEGLLAFSSLSFFFSDFVPRKILADLLYFVNNVNVSSSSHSLEKISPRNYFFNYEI